MSSAPSPTPFRYQHSANFPALLEQLGMSLAVTTYQAGKLMIVRSAGGKLSTLLRSMERPMGIAMNHDLSRMVLGTRRMVWTLRSAHEIAPQLEPKGKHDACYVPRLSHVTGNMQGHEIAVLDNEIWIVNTLFSCLCVLDDDGDYCFEPQWKPPFIDQLVGEDRCHLNGLAPEGNRVRYVTAMGETNTHQGWRDGKVTGGVVIDVESSEVVTRGLCMPHSPRVHDGRLYVLDSGRGLLCEVDRDNGERTTIASLPGFTRGLALHGRHAFVGLSQIREKDQFGGLPIAEQYGDDERQCGVCVVDLDSGNLVAFLFFEAGTAEIFDLCVLPGMRWPAVVGFQGEMLDGVMVAPEEAWARGVELPIPPKRVALDEVPKSWGRPT